MEPDNLKVQKASCTHYPNPVKEAFAQPSTINVNRDLFVWQALREPDEPTPKALNSGNPKSKPLHP